MYIEILLGCLGAIIASFTGVIVERIHTGQAWWKGRSRCNSCRRTLDTLDLIPVVSWILHRGRCRTCRSKIPYAYVVYEVLLGLSFAGSYMRLGMSVSLPVFLIFLSILGFVVLYDLRHMIVPVYAMILLGVSGLLLTLCMSLNLSEGIHTIITAGAIGLGFFLVYYLSRGRAMGLGDAPIALALSLAVGYPLAISGVVMSFWIGAVIGIVLLLVQRGRTTMKSEIPFVPFLAVGYLLAFFTGWNPFFLLFH